MPAKPTAPARAPALDHGLDLLECLAAADGVLTQRQIGDATGKAPSTVFRILSTLEQRGYVRRVGADAGADGGGGYAVTLKLYGLAELQPLRRRLGDLAAAALRELAQAVVESCHITVLDGTQVRVVCNQPSPAIHSLNVRPGSSYSAVQTAAGRLLLGRLEPSRRAVLLADDPVFAGLSAGEQAEVKQDLLRSGRKDRLVSPSQVTPGVLDVDVVIPGVWRGDDAVLAVPCLRKWTPREQRDALMPAIDAAVSQIVERCAVLKPGA